jgi:glyoxylase-like metal-dependent hydrolase (beta-lactamase superfamily II)
MKLIEQGWIQLRGLIVHQHLLYDHAGITLIDGGFLGGVNRLEQQLAKLGRTWTDIHAILLTHGHLDHTLNIARLKDLTGAKVIAPKGDEEHVAGTYRYRGIARFCGWAESLGRRTLRYRVPRIERWVEDGETLDYWGGLRVVALPGHTQGHVGYYSPTRRLLFPGDLFVNFLGPPRLPPPWFTVDRMRARSSIHIAAALDLAGVSPSHSKRAGPDSHLLDLQKLCRRHPKRT